MISFDEKLNNLNKKTMDLKQLYREETNLEPYQCIEIENNFTRHYVNWLEAKINYTHSCKSDSREEYNKALDIVEAYHKQLFLCGVGSSLITKKTPITEWSEYDKLPTKIKNVFKKTGTEFMEDMTYELMMRQAYLGYSHWSTFIALRGY
jgi:hypothetical protein